MIKYIDTLAEEIRLKGKCIIEETLQKMEEEGIDTSNIRKTNYSQGNPKYPGKVKITTISRPRYNGNIEDNYQKYLSEGIMIGFTKTFPDIKEITDTIEIFYSKGPVDTVVKVHFGKLYIDKEWGDYGISAVFTERTDISSQLPMNGWGSHCYEWESKIMEDAIITMCKKHDLMICKKINSWPAAKAIVQLNHFKN